MRMEKMLFSYIEKT